VLVLGNLSPVEEKMPMNAWTLAHKIGHGFQDHMSYRANGWRNEWGDAMRAVNKVLHQIATDSNDAPGTYTSDYPDADRLARNLTMKSARDHKLKNDFETFAEVVAQYLINGKVTLRTDDIRDRTRLIDLNRALNNLFKMLVGKVLVEV
jgi:hypothetical protein